MKQNEPVPRKPDPSIMPCCGRAVVGVPLIVVAPDGSEDVVGRVIQCQTDSFDGKTRVECRKVHNVRRLREWPASLSADRVRQLFDERYPSYLRTSGHHVRLEDGAWIDCRVRPAPSNQKQSEPAKDIKAAAAGEEAPQPYEPGCDE